MGSLNDGSPDLASFTGQVFKKGLDLGRCTIKRDFGVYTTADGTTLRAGQLVSRDATGLVIPATGADVFGVAKWNKQQFGVSVNVDEPLVFTSAAQVLNLKRPNVSNVAIRAAAGFGSAAIAQAGNYTVVAANGTVADIGGNLVALGTVYVTYTYALADADFEFDGRDFRNQANDDVTGSEGKITVITDWSLLYTMEWASGAGITGGATIGDYALTGADSNLYCDALGKFSNIATANEYVGKVFQLPTAQDPYMGVTVSGNPVEV